MATFQKKVFTGLAAALLTLGSTGLNAAEALQRVGLVAARELEEPQGVYP